MIWSTWDYSEAVAAFVAFGLWAGRREIDNCQAVGFGNESEGLIAGFVFHNWDPDTRVIEITGYSAHRKWMTKPRLREIFSYPFDDLGARICLARTSEHNTRPLRMWRALGASLYPIPDLRADGEAEIVSIFHRDVWNASRFKR